MGYEFEHDANESAEDVTTEAVSEAAVEQVEATEVPNAAEQDDTEHGITTPAEVDAVIEKIADAAEIAAGDASVESAPDLVATHKHDKGLRMLGNYPSEARAIAACELAGEGAFFKQVGNTWRVYK